MLTSRSFSKDASVSAVSEPRLEPVQVSKPAHPFDCFCVRTLESVGRHCPSFAALMVGVMAVFILGVLAAICYVIEGKI